MLEVVQSVLEQRQPEGNGIPKNEGNEFEVGFELGDRKITISN